MERTYIDQAHPGYYFWTDSPEMNANAEFELRWQPVRGYYSPPLLHQNIKCNKVPVPDEFLPDMGLVIGKNGVHFKWITERSKVAYIFFCVKTKQIEVWGVEEKKLDFAIHLIQRHLDHIKIKYNL